MLADKLEKPITFSYEDVNGNKLPFDIAQGLPNMKWHAQHSKSLSVQHSICFGNRPGEDKWPVKLLKWLLRKVPSSWRKPSSYITFNTSINSAYPIVKYLVEQRDFTFNDACVISADLCERCYNLLLVELNNEQVPSNYFKTIRTICDHCKTLDNLYFDRYRTWACYRTFKLKGNIIKAFDNFEVNSGPGVIFK